MEKIRFSAICEKLFLQPLFGEPNEVLYFAEPQVISAGLALSGFDTGLKGRVVLIGKEEVAYILAQPADSRISILERLKDAELIILAANNGQNPESKVEYARTDLRNEQNSAGSNKTEGIFERTSGGYSIEAQFARAAQKTGAKSADSNKTEGAFDGTSGEYSIEAQLARAAQKMGVRAAKSLRPDTVVVDLALYIEGRLNSVDMIHGDLLDVCGVGVLIVGESGLGKSEIALDLVTRGHLLVADDAVAVRREGGTLIGCSPAISRHLMEVRGIGIVDVRELFGAGCIKVEQNMEVVISLEPFSESRDYMQEQWFTHKGVTLPKITLPLGQGRNIAALIEVAAKNLKLKSMGYDAYAELERRIVESRREGRGRTD